VVPTEEVPADFLEHMVEIILEHKMPKLGLGLKLDDIPDHYKHKEEVIGHELRLVEIHKTHLDSKYCRIDKVPIDTTFALCKIPDCGLCGDAWRMGTPYIARHLPWYYDSENIPEEEKFMRANKASDIGHWSSQIG